MKEAAKDEEKKNPVIKGCPLSMDAWMTVLSSEINRMHGSLLHCKNISLVVVGVMVAAVFGALSLMGASHVWVFYLLVVLNIFLVCVCLFVFLKTSKLLRILKELESIRNSAIAGSIDSNETCKIWVTGW